MSKKQQVVDQVVDMSSKNDNLKDAVGKRLRIARERLGLTQKEFCERIGMPLPTLRDQELCKRIPGGEAISAFMSAGISADWLLTGKGNMLQDSPDVAKYDSGNPVKNNHEVREPSMALYRTDAAHGYIAIPVYSEIAAAAAVNGSKPKQAPTEALMFHEEWIKYELDAAPRDLMLIRVSGNSMEPSLRAGDMMLINVRYTSPNREGIYVLKMGETLAIKHISAIPGGKLHISSDNPNYKSVTIAPTEVDKLVIFGRMVWLGRRY